MSLPPLAETAVLLAASALQAHEDDLRRVATSERFYEKLYGKLGLPPRTKRDVAAARAALDLIEACRRAP